MSYLSKHLQDLPFTFILSQNSESLQTTQVPQNLPLLLLQTQFPVGDQGLVSLQLVRSPGVLLSSPLNQPVMARFLFGQ